MLSSLPALDLIDYGFTVAPLAITSIDLGVTNKGATLDVTITGAGFTEGSTVDFGDGITVNSFTVNSDTQITASITIADGAATGLRDVSVTTPEGIATLADAFRVTQLVDGTASGSGCGCSSAAASAADIGSGWGIVGLLGVSVVYTNWRRKKRK